MEATVICIDNSEWTRNGDYTPTRFQAQADAVNLLAGAKTEANPENTVGILTMAGKTPRVLVTPTTDLGKILISMQGLEVEGASNLVSAVQIAQLALKHRQNKHQRQRIVLFVGSPIAEDKDTLVKLAKKLKKNNVAVDVVSLAAEDENTAKLEAFQEAVNSGDNSHLVLVPSGTILSDSLYSTPLFQGEGHGFGGGEALAAGEGQEGFNFGVDPSLDPELALALRVSLEEERARQEAAQQAAGGQPGASEAGGAQGGDASASTPAPAAAAPAAAADAGGPMDDDALLQQALAMSMAVDAPEPVAGGSGSAPAAPAGQAQEPEDASMFDAYDEELQAALRMSMAEVQPGDGGQPQQPAEAGASAPAASAATDPAFVTSVLESLPGVNAADPALQEAVRALEQMGQDGQGEGGGSGEQEDKADK